MADPARKRRAAVRGILASWCVVLAIFLAYRFWGLHEQSLLTAQVEEYFRGGGPVLLDDFNRPTGLADADNAAIDLRAAARMIDDARADWLPVDGLWSYLPFDDDERRDLRASLAAYAPVLARVDVAFTKPGVDWKIRYTTPPIDMVFPDLNEQRNLARLLAAAALEAHERGDDRTAVTRVRQILFVGRAVGKQYAMVQHLVSTGLLAYGSDVAAQLVPELRVGSARSPVENPATPAEVRALIADLLEEEDYRAAGLRAVIGKRAFDLEDLLSLGQPSPTSPGTHPPPTRTDQVALRLAEPAAYGPARRLMAYDSAFVSVVSLPDWNAARAAIPARLADGNSPFSSLAATFSSGLDRLLKFRFATMSARRTTAAALAARWYAAEHDGRLPPSLAALVPAYLPAVPADPMDQSRPVHYLPAGPEGPFVYSAGENATDDGGSSAIVRFVEWDAVFYREADFVVHLTRQPRPPKPPPELMIPTY